MTDVLSTYHLEGHLYGKILEPYVDPSYLAGVHGITHSELGERGDIEEGEVVQWIVEDHPGEVFVESIEIGEVDYEGLESPRRHLGDGLLVLDILLFVPVLLDESSEGLLRSD